MQDVELFTPGLEHTAELGRICFEAFRQLSEGHGFERDFPDTETAAKVIGLIQGLPGSFQVAARADGPAQGDLSPRALRPNSGLAPAQRIGVGVENPLWVNWTGSRSRFGLSAFSARMRWSGAEFAVVGGTSRVLTGESVSTAPSAESCQVK